MADGRPGGQGDGWQAGRPRTDAKAAIRIVVGLLAVFVAILAVLALLNSFFIQSAPGPQEPTEPGPGPSPGPEGGQGERDITCQDIVDFFFWVFVGTGVVTTILLGVAVARRGASDGRILTNVWGILAIIGLFFTLLAAGAWRLVDWLCNGAPTCVDLINGFWLTYLVLLSLTVGSVAFGIAFAHMRRISFFRTGFGVLGIVLFLPALLTGVGWWVLRTFCNPDLWAQRPCAYLQETMASLAWIFWVALVVAAVSVVVGILYQRRTGVGVFRSGWAVLAVMLVVLAALSGFGWLQVKEVHDAIPMCNPDQEQPEEEEPPEQPTCQDILDRLGLVFWILLGATLLLAAVGLIFNHRDLKDFLKSVWTIIAYVTLALALIVGLMWLIIGSFCDGEGDQTGDGGTQGPGGGGGGGGGSGPGGGGGGDAGTDVPRPIEFDALPLTWVLIILAVLLAGGLLVLLLRRRAGLGKAGKLGAAPPSAEASPDEARRLKEILAKRKLDSADAVVAAYRVFLAWAAGNELPKEPAETPSEHAARVLSRFSVDAKAMQEFIGAYEIARMSDRPPSAKERELAVRFSREILRDQAPQEETP